MKLECRFLPEKAKNEFHGSARFAYQMFDHAVLIQQRRKIKFGKGREVDENEKEHGILADFLIGKRGNDLIIVQKLRKN